MCNPLQFCRSPNKMKSHRLPKQPSVSGKPRKKLISLGNKASLQAAAACASAARTTTIGHKH